MAAPRRTLGSVHGPPSGRICSPTRRKRQNGAVTPRRDRPAYKKRFGQHHLVQPELCDPAVRFLDPGGRAVVEIGPGGGILTRRLLDAGARVLACEIDLEWSFATAPSFRDDPVTWVAVDAQKLDWDRLPAGTRVAGNLPFNVGTPILVDLLARAGRVDRMAFLVQKEVAERICATPGTRDWGALGVWTAAWAFPVRLGDVKPGSFRPPPRVWGSFVGLRARDAPVLPRERMGRLEELVRAAFSQRRKTIRNSLGARLGRERVEAVLEAAGVDPSARAEQLDLDAFVRLTRASFP